MTLPIKINNILVDNIILVTFGSSKTPGLTKARIREITEGDRSFFQEEKFINNKAFHKNIERDDLTVYITDVMTDEYKSAVIYSSDADFYIRRTKKGALSIMKRNATKADLSQHKHNAEKKYLIPEGKSVGFLVELGIMSTEGQVFQKHFSKFRQINRFLELVDDEINRFKSKEIVSIADLCCGKGYLTLAVHYYFTEIKKQKTNIIGMDLKSDVISKLNNISKKLNLKGVKFEYGDIKDAKLKSPDLVVALHACDIATDIALTKAVEAGAGLIMSVPCCQHELFKQIENEDLYPILKYGILKDKFTELATNALRGLALEAKGYQVKMIEFTSIEHTMKNIMIKAVRNDIENNKAQKEFFKFSKLLNVVSSAEEIIKTE